MESIKELATRIEDLEDFKKNLASQYQAECGASYTITINRQIPAKTIELHCGSTIMLMEKVIDAEIAMLKQILKSKL